MLIFGCAGSFLRPGPFLSCSEQGCSVGQAQVSLIMLLLLLQSRHGLQGAWASVLATPLAPRSTGSTVVARWASCSVACGIFPGSGTEPVPPTLAGGPSTTEPLGEAPSLYFLLWSVGSELFLSFHVMGTVLSALHASF